MHNKKHFCPLKILKTLSVYSRKNRTVRSFTNCAVSLKIKAAPHKASLTAWRSMCAGSVFDILQLAVKLHLIAVSADDLAAEFHRAVKPSCEQINTVIADSIAVLGTEGDE